MNRFNGLCKVCSERRYRQVGAWPLGGVSLGLRGGGSPRRASLPAGPSFPPPAPHRFTVTWGRTEAGTGPQVACTCRPSLEASTEPRPALCHPNHWQGGV